MSLLRTYSNQVESTADSFAWMSVSIASDDKERLIDRSWQTHMEKARPTQSSDVVIGRKSRIFYTPPVFSAPAGGDPVGIPRSCLILIKLEWLGYRLLKKLWQYVKPFS